MPAIYLTNVMGSGTMHDPFRPNFPSNAGYQTLMIDDGPKKRACVWSPDLNVSGAGIIKIQSAPTKQELIDLLQATTATNQQKNAVNNWLNQSSYNPLPGGTLSQYDVVLFVCRQVNPDVDLSVLTE